MKGTPKHRIYLPCFVAVLVLLSLQPTSAVVLQYKGKVGEKFNRKTSFTGEKTMTNLTTGQTQRTQISGSLMVATRVVSVSSVELKLEKTVLSGETTTTVSGQKQSQPAKKSKSWLRITPQGKVLEEKPRKQDEERDIGARVLKAIAEAGAFPKDNINVGDVWKTSVKVKEPGRNEPLPITLESKLLGIIDFKGHSCAKIKTTFQVQLNSHYVGTNGLPAGASADMRGKISGTITYYFDPKLGREIYSESKMQSSLKTTLKSQGQSQEIKSEANLTTKSSLLESAR